MMSLIGKVTQRALERATLGVPLCDRIRNKKFSRQTIVTDIASKWMFLVVQWMVDGLQESLGADLGSKGAACLLHAGLMSE